MDPIPASPHRPFRSGVLFGCGFSVPFVVLLVVGQLLVGLVTDRKMKAASSGFVRKSFGADAHLVVLEHAAQRGASSLYVYGRVGNQGTDAWDHAILQVRLLSSDGKLVGVCNGGTMGPLHPGREAYFQVNCDNWDRDAFPKYERYEVDVADASPDF
jgi:hypothetical protein